MLDVEIGRHCMSPTIFISFAWVSSTSIIQSCLGYLIGKLMI